MAKERCEIRTNVSIELFSKIRHKISRYALVLLKKQYLYALDRDNLKTCTGYYSRVLEIPCEHVIYCHIDTRQPFEDSEFIKLWELNIDRNENTLDPKISISCIPSASRKHILECGRSRNPRSAIRPDASEWSGRSLATTATTALKLATTGFSVPHVQRLSPSKPKTLISPPIHSKCRHRDSRTWTYRCLRTFRSVKRRRSQSRQCRHCGVRCCCIFNRCRFHRFNFAVARRLPPAPFQEPSSRN